MYYLPLNIPIPFTRTNRMLIRFLIAPQTFISNSANAKHDWYHSKFPFTAIFCHILPYSAMLIVPVRLLFNRTWLLLFFLFPCFRLPCRSTNLMIHFICPHDRKFQLFFVWIFGSCAWDFCTWEICLFYYWLGVYWMSLCSV